jgi:hypothetical protein
MTQFETTVEQARAAGFTQAADLALANRDRVRRMALAYEHYRYVTQQQIDQFNSRLYALTSGVNGGVTSIFGESYDVLTLVDAAAYHGIPPADVLVKVQEAKQRGIFDTFVVAEVITRRIVQDPIIFGRVAGCDDLFFVAQWGEDVKLTDLISANEG